MRCRIADCSEDMQPVPGLPTQRRRGKFFRFKILRVTPYFTIFCDPPSGLPINEVICIQSVTVIAKFWSHMDRAVKLFDYKILRATPYFTIFCRRKCRLESANPFGSNILAFPI